MTAIGMILKSMGIEVTDEHRAQIEALIPQIPARAVQVLQVVNAAVAKVNENTAAIQALHAEVTNLRDDNARLCALVQEILQNKEQENGRTDSHDNDGPTAGADSPALGASGGTRYLNGNPAKRKRLTT
jgi:FtsZ-binding cell division protein ZapB